jgi:hypothetical protein
MSKLIELTVAELNKNNVYQINESDDPMVHVYTSHPKQGGGWSHKHIGTMKLSHANKKYETNMPSHDIQSHNPLGMGCHVGDKHDLPHIPTPGRQKLAYVHASWPVENKLK